MIYALSPKPVAEFVTAFDAACATEDGWRQFYEVLGRIVPQRHRLHFDNSVPETLATTDEVEGRLSPDVLPSSDGRDAIFRTFARWSAPCYVSLNETKFFLQSHWRHKDIPELEGSGEWRLIRDYLLTPDRIPEDFWFLEGNRDNATACCMSVEEAREILRAEQAERRLDRGQILWGADAHYLLGILHFSVAQSCFLWHYEVS